MWGNWAEHTKIESNGLGLKHVKLTFCYLCCWLCWGLPLLSSGFFPLSLSCWGLLLGVLSVNDFFHLLYVNMKEVTLYVMHLTIFATVCHVLFSYYRLSCINDFVLTRLKSWMWYECVIFIPTQATNSLFILLSMLFQVVYKPDIICLIHGSKLHSMTMTKYVKIYN